MGTGLKPKVAAEMAWLLVGWEGEMAWVRVAKMEARSKSRKYEDQSSSIIAQLE